MLTINVLVDLVPVFVLLSPQPRTRRLVKLLRLRSQVSVLFGLAGLCAASGRVSSLFGLSAAAACGGLVAVCPEHTGGGRKMRVDLDDRNQLVSCPPVGFLATLDIYCSDYVVVTWMNCCYPGEWPLSVGQSLILEADYVADAELVITCCPLAPCLE